MIKKGYGGRNCGHFGDPLEVLRGVLVSDPPVPPKEGWNKPKYDVTPFGLSPRSGALFARCGNCRRMLYPVVGLAYVCRCDFEIDGKERLSDA